MKKMWLVPTAVVLVVCALSPADAQDDGRKGDCMTSPGMLWLSNKRQAASGEVVPTQTSNGNSLAPPRASVPSHINIYN